MAGAEGTCAATAGRDGAAGRVQVAAGRQRAAAGGGGPVGEGRKGGHDSAREVAGRHLVYLR